MPENMEVIDLTDDTEVKDAETVDLVEEESPHYSLKRFKLTRILSNNTQRKSIALLGKFPQLSATNEAIVLFEKQAFRDSDVQTENHASANGFSDHDAKPSFFNDALKVRTLFVNNIYGSYECEPGGGLNNVKTTVVYPATAKHIEKYSVCQKFVISETPILYETVTLPYMNESQYSLEWVYNILEHKQESERIVYEDADPETGFILLPDLKWDGKTIETLYLLVIVQKHNIKSLRDLNETHLPLLRKIRTDATTAIEQRYGLNANQLRLYFHYQPSFYHLHVHINPVRNDAPGIWCEKSHMLDTVINNIELLPDYYQRATIPFVVYDGMKLLHKYEEKGIIRKRTVEVTKGQEVPEEVSDTSSDEAIEKSSDTDDSETTEESKESETKSTAADADIEMPDASEAIEVPESNEEYEVPKPSEHIKALKSNEKSKVAELREDTNVPYPDTTSGDTDEPEEEAEATGSKRLKLADTTAGTVSKESTEGGDVLNPE